MTYLRLGSVDAAGLRVSLCCGPLAKARRGRDTVVGAYVRAKAPRLEAALAAVLRRWAGRVAERTRALGKISDDERERLLGSLDSDEMGRELTGELTGAMQAAFRRAAQRGAAQVGFGGRDIVRQVDRRAVEYARARGAQLIRDLAGTTEEYMRALLARAVEEGMAPLELADAVEESGAFGEARARVIARTELADAHVRGNVEGWKASGLRVRKRSILGDLHDVEDVCDEAAAAGVVDMDEDFVEGASFPPYHPNCVCDVEPVLEDEQEGDE